MEIHNCGGYFLLEFAKQHLSFRSLGADVGTLSAGFHIWSIEVARESLAA